MAKRTLKRISCLAVFMLTAVSLFAQGVITGKVIDPATNEGVPGANVIVKGTTNGTVTDIDGNFSLTAKQQGALQVSFIGYDTKSIPFDATKSNVNLGDIQLASDASALDEVVVIGSGLIDVIKDRQTPVAVSNIPVAEIKQKSGNQEFPEIMKNTPAVYVAGQAGGYGDSRINVRGFDQTNTAYLLNGQPINGMEDGKMYWSNWSGMNDIANAVQIQRGLGSSKLAISSVGGTVNIVTKATEKEKGGFLRFTAGNDAYIKATGAYNTGIMENGFGVSVLFTHWQGDGYNDGTKGQGQNYFISLGYKPNDKHMFNFLLTGAPQWHDQNYTKPITSLLKYGKKYNSNYGYLNGEYKTERRNFYHKPVANLNWDWGISDKSTLSTVLYASWGRGGGTGGLGSNGDPTRDGLVNFDELVRNNEAIGDGENYLDPKPWNPNNISYNGYALRASVNSHSWYGLITNFNHELSDKWSFNIGVDGRTYTGFHYRQIVDFMGLNSMTDNFHIRYPTGNTITKAYDAHPWDALTDKAEENERLAWDYDETINYAGLFGQLEYKTEHLSTYFQGAISTQSHERTDRYQYLPEDEKSEKITNSGYNVKGGANYKVNSNHSIFANIGYYSRQPYHDNIYLNFTNDVNPLTENEKVFGVEFGYQFRSQYFDASLNLYNTSWKDRVTTTSEVDENGTTTFYNNSGVNQLHQGIELDFIARVTQSLKFKGFISLGKWEYDDDVLERTYDENQNLLTEKTEEIKGGKVGDSPQTQFGLGFTHKILEGLSWDMDWRYNDRLYADVVTKDNIELPSYHLFDAGVSYEEPLNEKLSLLVRLNVNNLFNEEYISESRTAINDENDRGYTGLTYDGIDQGNSVHFGNGRTFNISATLKF